MLIVMPIYDFECPKCLKKEELLIMPNDLTGLEVTCVACKRPMTRLLHTVSFQLRGKGWYKPSAYQGTDKE